MSVNESMGLIEHKETSDNQQSDQAPEEPIISETLVDEDDRQTEQTDEIQSISDEVNDEPKSESEKKNE